MIGPTGLPSVMTFASKDPTAPLPCVPPSSPAPFERSSLLLRQSDTQSLDPIAERALNLFSSFQDRWKQGRGLDAEDAETMLKSLSEKGGEYEVRTDTMPNRRFSGDGSLSRARYFSLC